MKIPKSIALLESAVAEQQISAYALCFRLRNAEIFFGGHHGRAGSAAILSPVTAESIFDLASVTKIFVTSTLIHRAKRAGLLRLHDSIQKYLPSFRHANVSIRQALEHQTGLPAHIEFFERYKKGEAELGNIDALKKWLFAVDLKHESGKVTEYSDLGFMLLGFVLEQIYARPLDQLFYEAVIIPLGLNRTGFISLPHRKGQKNFDLHFAPGDFVATEQCPWRNKVLQGEVHDDNTWAAGGVMGHAGLFSTAQESLQMLESLALELKNDTDFSFPAASTRASHDIFSQGLMVYPGLRAHPGNDFAAAVGHTGFVGTSAWFQQECNLSVVLLTNRVHPSRSDTRWIQTRLNFHQSLWTELA